MENVKISAIRNFCESCIVPIIAEKNNMVGSEGTGILFEIDERLFLITASHVSDSIFQNPNNFGMPIQRKDSKILTFINCTLHSPKREQDKDKYDIGVIELTENKDIVGSIYKQFKPLSLSNIGKYHHSGDKYFLTGYPAERADQVSQELLLSDSIFILETTTYKKQLSDSIFNSTSESDIMLEYSKKIITKKGYEVDSPALSGISGGAIWQVVESKSLETGIWTVENMLKLVAIQCSYESRHYRWIRGIKLNVLAHSFSSIDKNISEKIWQQLS